ncbi:hypothetical protein QI155_10860 [Thermodesulfovibrio sp. 1176]|uniref:hypothetical protein n=1 Tax=Thermodesulfovibrio sp. 1176 TaxID=3043424 RepID=UPI0024828372|nr:hypothetical protein [Thermodesulfovibrio sp. 1176]MDI1473032.1 hypothetical protein [Thermodesulfovibrio sp. 1176]
MKKTVKILPVLLVFLLIINTIAFAKETSFTQEDRDRLVRVETRLEEGLKSLQKQIDDLKTFMLWGFGILFGGMGILIGFVIWDRRTALTPVIKRQREFEEKVEKALKELARQDPRVAEILKNVGLL